MMKKYLIYDKGLFINQEKIFICDGEIEKTSSQKYCNNKIVTLKTNKNVGGTNVFCCILLTGIDEFKNFENQLKDFIASSYSFIALELNNKEKEKFALNIIKQFQLKEEVIEEIKRLQKEIYKTNKLKINDEINYKLNEFKSIINKVNL